jgi:hypothetical protein
MQEAGVEQREEREQGLWAGILCGEKTNRSEGIYLHETIPAKKCLAVAPLFFVSTLTLHSLARRIKDMSRSQRRLIRMTAREEQVERRAR